MVNEKTVLVTGASRGIGRAIAERLVASGWHVIGTYLTNTEAATDLRRDLGIDMRQVDLADRGRTVNFAKQMRDEFTFDALVNNAGIIEFESFPELTMEAWDRTLEVNVSAPLLLSVQIGSAIRAGGSIVNVASTDAQIGSFSSIAYSASKAALLSINKSLANVLGPQGVRVNAVTPGWVDTDMSTDESAEAAELTPLGRNATPGEIARVVEFLLSSGASFVSGASIVVDGGYTGVDVIMKKENDSLA